MLNNGTKLGPYEIQSPLGAGGMGEVYRARDTRLDRTVAIKVLPNSLADNPEARQRLDREARSISSLNHAHICTLYDVGHEGGIDFLVMEYLEGETLADRLQQGALPLKECLQYGSEICAGLEAAHRASVVHRDLKPGNIMLTKSGVKLMDFGLAKPLGVRTAAVSRSAPAFTAVATISGPSPASPLTAAGSIVGTVQYMSPEQIEGKEADARSDIFSLGAVLYEMASGKRAFRGKSQISVASAILENDPDPISTVKPMTPPSFEHVVRTCLDKDPENRFQSARDVGLQLKWIAEAEPMLKAGTAAAQPNLRSRLMWIAAIVAALVLGAVAGLWFAPSREPARVIRTVINPPENTTFRLTGDFAGPPVISPDGKYVAFTAAAEDGRRQLWLRALDALEPRSLAGTEDAMFPFWSPDSHAIAFFAEGKLKAFDLSGGTPTVVCDATNGRGGSWGTSGVIVFSPDTQSGIVRVDATGGTPTPVTKLDHTRHTSHRWPFMLPDGRHFLYLALHHDPAHSENDAIHFASLDGSEDRVLFRSLANAVYGGGFLLTAKDTRLLAQAFDPSTGKLTGEPQSILDGVENDISTWHMDASVAGRDLLLMGSGGSSEWQLAWYDRSGKRLATAADHLANLQYTRLSPQGDRIALQIDTGVNDIWVLDLARGVRTRITFGPVLNTFPVWSPDGEWIAYNSPRNGRNFLLRKRADGSGAEETLLEDDQGVVASDWSRDGKYLLYMHGAYPGPYAGGEIWALPLQGDRKPFRVVSVGNARAANPVLSPDGRWLAYQSNESGTEEIYVVPFAGGAGKWQVSQGGGVMPRWRRDGKELFYGSNTFTVFSVAVKEAAGVPQFSSPQPLLRGSAAQLFFYYEVMPDGSKFLMPNVAQQGNSSVVLVTNWAAGLKK